MYKLLQLRADKDFAATLAERLSNLAHGLVRL